MNDLISKKAAIKYFTALWECIDDIMDKEEWEDVCKTTANELPSAELDRKTGKWIKNPEYIGDEISGFIDNHFSCSECKKEAEINSWGFYTLSDFCPNCGADMRGEQDEHNY